MMFKTSVANFEADIIDKLVSKPPSPNETEFDKLMRTGLNSYCYILELYWFSKQLWEDTNFMRRPWWMFWVSKERYFEEAYKQHLVEVEQKIQAKIDIRF